MTTKPTRCCVQTLKGTRCANEPSPVRSSRMIGPVEIAACGLDGHQRAMRSLPDFVRHDAYCGAVGCDRPSNAGICKNHRDQYRDFGITEHMLLAQEAPMPASETSPEVPHVAVAPKPPAEPQEAAGVGAPPSGSYLACIAPGCGDEDLMDLDQTTGLCGMCTRQKERTIAPPATVEEFLRDLESGDGEPSIGDIQDAYSGRWGQYTVGIDPATGKEHAAAYVVELVRPSDYQTTDALLSAIVGPRPTAPGPTVAELQQQLVAERARADLCDAEAVSQRQRAEAVEAELFEVDRTLQHLGAYGNGPTIDRLLKVLTPEDRRNILELQAAEARMDLARLRARRLNPAPPERVAELVARVATLDARIAALDAERVQG